MSSQMVELQVHVWHAAFLTPFKLSPSNTLLSIVIGYWRFRSVLLFCSVPLVVVNCPPLYVSIRSPVNRERPDGAYRSQGLTIELSTVVVAILEVFEQSG